MKRSGSPALHGAADSERAGAGAGAGPGALGLGDGIVFLQRAAGRWRLLRVWKGAWFGCGLGCGAWVLLVALHKLAVLPLALLSAGPWLPATLALFGLLAGGWRRIDPGQLALSLDAKEQLQDRLATAWELHRREDHASSVWIRLVLTDAAASVRRLSLKRMLPLRLPRAAHWAAVALALGVGLGFVPEYRSARARQRQRETEIARETGEQLLRIARHRLAQDPAPLDATRRQLESLADLGEALAGTKLNRVDALSELARLTEQIRETQRQHGHAETMQRLRAAAQQPATEPVPQAEAATARAAAIDQLRQQIASAQENAAAGSANAPLPGSRAQPRPQTLDSIVRRAAELGLPTQAVDAARAANRSQELDAALRQLEDALNALAHAPSAPAAAPGAPQPGATTAAAPGQSLPDLLGRGQVAAAREAMERMAAELRSGAPTAEALRALAQQLRDAAQAGARHGGLPQALDQAAANLNQGNSQSAAQNLEAGAQQLQALADQMLQPQDAQSLGASLEALARAQLAIGMSAPWAQSRNLREGQSPNGQPGPGVGTWASESASWAEPPATQPAWDNSGLRQPDAAPRGLTDRGQTRPTAALAPTQLKGQTAPGSPMPSVSLKGVHLKGQSSVAYEQAALQAQAEAQRALNQDQVPRAYQGAVRSYFDDLKP